MRKSLSCALITPAFSPDYHYGGIVTALEGLFSGLSQLDEACIIVYTLSDRKGSSKNGRMTVFQRSRSLLGVLALIYDVQKSKHDIYYISGVWQVWMAIIVLILRLKGSKLIYAPHGSFVSFNVNVYGKKKKLLYFKLILKNLIRGTTIHYSSEFERKSSPLLEVMDVKSFVLPNILSLINHTRVIPKNNEKKLKILIVGRPDPVKNYDKMIDIIEGLVNRKNSLVECIIIGQRNEYISKLIKGRSAEFILTGHLNHEQVLGYYNQATHVMVLSNAENFSMVILEGLYHGLVPISHNRIGITEYLDENEWIDVTDVMDETEKIVDKILFEYKAKKVSESNLLLDKQYWLSHYLREFSSC